MRSAACKKRRKYLASATLMVLVPLLLLPNSRPVYAQDQCTTFPETGKSVCGRFLDYWTGHGGESLQGLPVSDLLQEKSDTDGKTYQVQYFERALFELHTDNPAPYDVLLSLLGAARYLEYYGPSGAGDQHADTDNPRHFAETGHTIGGKFRTYWEQHGGLAQFGFPISDEFVEISNMDGRPYTVQYFERALFEYHPEYNGTPNEVLLAQLGAYRYRAVYGALSIPNPIPPATLQGGITGSQAYLLWTDAQRVRSNLPNDIIPDTVPTTNWILNLYSNQEFTATLDTDLYSYQGTNGPFIVWQGAARTCFDCGSDVYGRNLRTGDTFPLDVQPGNRADPVVAGDEAAYIEYSYANNLDQQRLVLKNLALGDTKIIASHTQGSGGYGGAYIDKLEISDEYVVWTEISQQPNGRTTTEVIDLYAYNKESDKMQHIAQYSGESLMTSEVLTFGMQIALSGHYLAWTDPTLHLINLDSGETQVIFNQGAYYPVMRGNDLVWNATDTGTLKGSKGIEIWGTTISKPDAKIVVGLQAHYNWGPIIAGDWLIWLGYQHIEGISLYKAFAGN